MVKRLQNNIFNSKFKKHLINNYKNIQFVNLFYFKLKIFLIIIVKN